MKPRTYPLLMLALSALAVISNHVAEKMVSTEKDQSPTPPTSDTPRPDKDVGEVQSLAITVTEWDVAQLNAIRFSRVDETHPAPSLETIFANAVSVGLRRRTMFHGPKPIGNGGGEAMTFHITPNAAACARMEALRYDLAELGHNKELMSVEETIVEAMRCGLVDQRLHVPGFVPPIAPAPIGDVFYA